MTRSEQRPSAATGFVLATVFGTFVLLTCPARAQTYSVIYKFTGCADGEYPGSTLIMDGSGALYGTTGYGGSSCGTFGNGVVYRLKRAGSGWVESPIHTFTGGIEDGSLPENYGGLIFGPDGNLYGSAAGGGQFNLGVVFRLQPPARACKTVMCPWNLRLLHNFAGDPDGAVPYAGVVFDSAGNLYGTTNEGGSNFGTAYGLTQSGDNWNESVLANIGGLIFAGLLVGSDGNLYGVNYEGGHGSGVVFQLTPSGSGWTENVLYTFTGGLDGGNPAAALVQDAAGNIFGATVFGGQGGGGTVFEFIHSGQGWNLNTIHSFSGHSGPFSRLTLDSAGNLYGTTTEDGAFGLGMVFKLTRSGDSWTFTDLHDFHAAADGLYPTGGVTLDSNGNLYGTTSQGGTSGFSAGVVWQITP